jgi:hypothetical protein
LFHGHLSLKNNPNCYKRIITEFGSEEEKSAIKSAVPAFVILSAYL